MELVVRALRCPPPDAPQALRARFGVDGGRIGRAVTCALVLPSPDRTVSREHLEVRCRDGLFSLKLLSTVNGCSVNDRALPPRAEVALADGDTIRLGDYVLRAELRPGEGASTTDPLGAFAGLSGGRAEPFDVMALLAAPLAPTPTRDDAGASALDAFLGGAQSPSPALGEPAQGLYRRHVVDLAMPDPCDSSRPGPLDDIFSALEQGALPQPSDGPRAARAVQPDERGPDTAVAEGTGMLAALARALGLEPGDLDAARPVETMRLVGDLLRRAVGGLVRLVDMRARLKDDFRIEDRTTIALRDNNPLKHADNARDVLRYLVDPRQHDNRLFMPPSQALEDAVSDLCAHETAVMAGTRAALRAALGLFSPETVEARIEKTGVLDGMVPALRRARLWESYLDMRRELAKEAEDRFDRLLDREFARAYAERAARRRGP